MDWVPGGIDRIFATYERIVSHQHTDHQVYQADDGKTPPIDAPTEPVKPDAPPWQAPETVPQQVVPTNDMFTRMEAGDQTETEGQRTAARGRETAGTETAGWV